MKSKPLPLAPLPEYRINQEVRCHGFKADIVGCFWGEDCWKYEVFIRRGKKQGYWIIREDRGAIQLDVAV